MTMNEKNTFIEGQTPGTAMVASFKQVERVLITAHHNPDGDALGSISALARALMSAGKSVEIFLAGIWPERLDFLLEDLPRALEVADISDHDLTVLLDCHSLARLDNAGTLLATRLEELPSNPLMAVIDHHQLDAGEEVSPLWFFDGDASSTGELVLNFIETLGWELSPLSIQSLLVAMASDTGFFSQSNAKASTLRATADLLDKGGDLVDISRRLKGLLTLGHLKLKGLMLDSLEVHCNGFLSIMSITSEMLEKSGATKEDTEDLIEEGRNLAGIRLSALIKDYGGGPGHVRVSLRSFYPVQARLLALQFGGGGHPEASAYNDPQAKNAEEARNNLLVKAPSIL